MIFLFQKVCHLQQELARWKTLEQERAEQVSNLKLSFNIEWDP